MKKQDKFFIYGIILSVLFMIMSASFFFDLGFNSRHALERDFAKAFTFRVTGDCDSFVDYIALGKNDWKDRCEKEKARNAEPISEFKVLTTSKKIGSNRAFLQVELQRNDKPYVVNYEMIRETGRWKINQEIKK